MNLTSEMARRLRHLYFGGNWTWVSLKETLTGVSWQEATTPVHGCNSIAALVYHMNWYLNRVHGVLQGSPLTGQHEESFHVPPVTSKQEWDQLLDQVWNDAEAFALTIQQLPGDKITETFSETKYGSIYRNIEGIIEHGHYHLGQIVLLKKFVVCLPEAK